MKLQSYSGYVIIYIDTTGAAINMPKQTISNTLVVFLINNNADYDSFGLYGFSRSIFKVTAMKKMGEMSNIRISIITSQLVIHL